MVIASVFATMDVISYDEPRIENLARKAGLHLCDFGQTDQGVTDGGPLPTPTKTKALHSPLEDILFCTIVNADR